MDAPLIAIDARSVRPGMTGVGRRVAQMLRAMIRGDHGLRWGLFTNTPGFLAQWLGGEPLPHVVTLWPVGARPESHPGGEWWLNVTLPRFLRREGAALFDGPAFAGPWRRIGVPLTLTIHDLVHRLRPATQPWLFRRWLSTAVRRGSRVADRIVVPSPAVAAELEALHPHTRGKITVIPGGFDSAMTPLTDSELAAFREEHGLPRRWLLHVGTFEPRKNHRFLIEVHTALCAEIDDPPPLIMAGGPGPTLHRVERWIERSPWADRIHIQTGVSDRDLRGFLSGAAALIFPSLSEGFGLPVLEALAMGAPVVASDVPGLDFFRDSPATLLPLGAVQPWVSALRRILSEPPTPEPSRRWAADFTWERAAERQIALWRQMIGM